ncbi:MAG: O-antigen ligase family protein, partial [Methyloligellaceae bacterium]
MTLTVRLLYIFFFALTFAFAKLSFGLPARSILLIVLFLSIVVFYPRQFSEFFERHIGFFIFCLALTLVGFALTTYYGGELSEAAQFMNENTIQLYLTFSCVYLVCMILGPVYTANIFIFATLATGLVGIFQFLGIDFFWQIREQISGIQTEPVAVQQWVASRHRALGVSYSTMNLAYQTIACLLIVCLMCNARFFRPALFNWFIFFAFLIGIATGVRSLLVAVVLCALISNILNIHSARANQRLYFYVLVLGALVVLSVLSLTSPDLRIFSASDDSAAGRLVLAKLGLNLVLDNPFGFGWDFDSRNYFWIYWSQLLDYQNADAVYHHGLHNYFLNFFLTYGVLGVLALVIAFAIS